MLGRVLRPEAPGQDIETCPKEQRLGPGLLLEPYDDALQPRPVDGSLFGLHAEEVEGGDGTQISACRRRVNGLGRWVAEARWLDDRQLWRGAQDALDILLVHLADDDEDGGPRVCVGHRLDAHGLHVGPVEAQAPGEIALPGLARLIVPLSDRLACCLRFRSEQVYP